MANSNNYIVCTSIREKAEICFGILSWVWAYWMFYWGIWQFRSNNNVHIYCTEFCSSLVNNSAAELHSMFTRTYGVVYQQNARVFSKLFSDLQLYLQGSGVDLSDSLDGFFSSLLLRMFSLMNGQYSFDERYLSCLSERSTDLAPFGDVPHKLSVQLKRAFVASRTFHHGLEVARDVISLLDKVIVGIEVAYDVFHLQW